MPIAVLVRKVLQRHGVCFRSALSLSLLAGCSGSIGSVGNGQADGSGGNSSAMSSGLDETKPVQAPAAGVELSCARSGISPGKSPLRRLTNVQFTNSLRDLFKGTLTVGEVDLPRETPVGGYDNNVLGQFAAPTLLEGYRNAAKGIAAAAGAKDVLQKLAPCASGQDPLSCGQSFLAAWAPKVYRRPLEGDELARLQALFKASHASDGYAAAVSDTLQAMLSSPQFLYRVEAGGEEVDGAVKLNPFQLASRLSYLLWDSIPDSELTSAAAGGGLGTATAIEKQVDRMMKDPRAKAAVARFHSQWLMLDKIGKSAKDPKMFPLWNDAVSKSLKESTAKYVDHIFWNTPTVTDLLTDTHAFVDSSTSWIWGSSNKSASLELVDLGKGRRSGLLTQAGLMAAFAKPSVDSSVFRGLFVTRQLLCLEIPEPPAGVSTTIPEPAPGAGAQTARQRQEASHSERVCAGCHASIDGIGFGFGHYDAVGGWRDKDNGINVDASGELVGTRDADGKFAGAIELSERLSKSVQVQQCIATHWFRWSFGRTETDQDNCALLPIVNRFVSSKGDLNALVKAVATSDAFRYIERP